LAVPTVTIWGFKVMSTFLGGIGAFGTGITLDANSSAYVTGYTPFTVPAVNAFQPETGGQYDAFLSVIAMDAPTAVFRDSNGAIQLTSPLWPNVSFSAGGVFASDPAVAYDSYAPGETYVAARDQYGAIWWNIFHLRSRTWDGWKFAGGLVQGDPSITVKYPRLWIAARDNFNAAWVATYDLGLGTFSGWTNIGGVFATDPLIAAGSFGPTFYVVAKDEYGAIWSYLPSSTPIWSLLGGAVASGKPSVVYMLDGTAYIAIRDTSNAVWMGRVTYNTWSPWQAAGGVVASDPKAVRVGANVFAAVLTSSGEVWYNRFAPGIGNNWLGWQSPGGILSSVAPAGSEFQTFLVGRDPSNQVCWYETPGRGWIYGGLAGVAASSLATSP
jgi:hypothetical protein